MKLTIKPLHLQTSLRVDIDDDKTVKELKEKIEKDHGTKDFPCSSQKLIYSGKILVDETKLTEYNIDEKKFIVLMITRPPPPPKAPTAEKLTKATTSDKQIKKEDSSGSKAKSSAETTKSKQPAATAAPTQSASAATPSATATTTGAPAAANTTTSATPAPTTTQSSNSDPTMIQQAAARASAVVNASSSMNVGDSQVINRLAALMTQPHFRQIQDMIQQSPHLLSSTIDSLASTDPELYSFISENPDVFVSALNHPPLAGSHGMQSTRNPAPGEASQLANPSDRGSQHQGRNPVEVLVSERDKAAIERLKELGFSEYLAVQAYMACDKDEQLAANLLFQMD